VSRLPRRPLARRLAALAVGTSLLAAAGIAATASVTLKITSLTVSGIRLPVGNSCQTSPFSVTLSSGSGFTVGGGGPVSGSYTIPAFHHCLLNTLLLNLTIPGPGNTLNLTLGQLQLG
jgi:hypothetical protein